MKALVVMVVAALAVAGFAAARHRGERVMRAEFASARGLVTDNDVRLAGAVVGRVRSISLTPRGTAVVEVGLGRGAPAPRADATAAIRPGDLLGDTYVSYDPGRARAPLHGKIGLASTANAPRLDDLLATFGPGVRAGLRTLLVEAGVALDARGPDLNRLALALRPALGAAHRTLGELARERRTLGALVADAEHAAGPLARRERDLGALVERLRTVLRATAAHRGPLAAGLDGLPATLRALRGTAARLDATATAARPVAVALAGSAPALGRATAGASPLLARGRAAARALTPLAGTLRGVLARGAPTLRSLAGGVGAVRGQAPDAAALAHELVPAAEGISRGFFEDFADQAAEPGRQPFDPFADPSRAYWRGAAVFSCEAFGVPVRPGCLREALGGERARERRPRQALGAPRPAAPSARPPLPAVPAAPAVPLPKLPAPAVPPAPAPHDAQQLLDYLLGR